MNTCSRETLFQGMETSASDTNDECLVTDLVHELSTGLEIPFLLGDNIRSVGKAENFNALDTMFYEEPIKESQEGDPYFSFANNCESVLSIKEENNDIENFLENGNFMQVHSTNSFSGSGSGSGSECSSTEFWTTKVKHPTDIELDTPPITPPDERISPDSVFLLPTDELKFIPICAEENVNGENKMKNNYKTIDKKVRIQPKPVSTSLNIFDAKPLDVQTVMFNVVSDVNSDSLESNILLNSGFGKKKSLLTKKDLELLQAKRKQERMIRNRESAYLSRKRKKEHVAHLEKQVQDLQSENKQLRLENCSLRQRLARYENLEPPKGKKTGNLFSESPRKTTALLALLFTVCLNIGSFSSLMNEKRVYKSDIDVVSENIVPNYPSELRHTRSLLWADSDLGSLNSSYTNLTKTSCPLSVNQTESIRLESELRRWIGDEDHSRQAKYNVSKISQYFYLGERPSQRKNLSKRKQRVLKSTFQRRNLEMDQMYQMNVLNFNTFFEAIHRRDDTFYLVSFSSDHLLLPALSHNQTSRPKMSLMLPAFLSNGTGADQVEMMQIDCEVTNTQLLSVNENDIPSQMRPYSNSTSRPKNKTKRKAKKFDEYFVSDLSGTLVPAENVTFKTGKSDYSNSSGNHSNFSHHNSKSNISESRDFEVLNFTVSNGDFGDRNPPYLQYKKTGNFFDNQTYKQDANAVEFIPNSGKNFFKLLRVVPTAAANRRATKFNSERVSYKQYRNASKFLFN